MDLLDLWGVAVALFWLGLLLDLARAWPGELRLDPQASDDASDSDAESAQDTLVLVPSRDEAPVVDECLSSLLVEAGSFRRLVYVDDRSEDGTGDIARRVIADSGADAAEVIDGVEPAEGWSGKLWALERAWRHARESDGAGSIRWILLTDADIRHPRGSIRALRRVAEAEDRDLVSVMVRLRAESFWERVLIPPFVYFFQLLYPFRRVRDDRSRVAAAAGGCVLVRREVFERSGGFESIRGEIIDDVNLARSVASVGGRLWLGTCDSMLSVRSYESLREIVQMVARTAFTQLRYSYSLLAACAAILLTFLVAPPVLLVLSILGGASLGIIGAVIAWSVQTWTLSPVVRHHRVSGLYAATLPFASLLYLWMTCLSAWRHLTRRGVAWKGRSIS